MEGQSEKKALSQATPIRGHVTLSFYATTGYQTTPTPPITPQAHPAVIGHIHPGCTQQHHRHHGTARHVGHEGQMRLQNAAVSQGIMRPQQGLRMLRWMTPWDIVGLTTLETNHLLPSLANACMLIPRT